ncbi:MAG: hypothetical protein KDA22_07895 [Phycisphaerales bacterium]|nr:hypothetical protein [Phycisphaerales bacterium]
MPRDHAQVPRSARRSVKGVPFRPLELSAKAEPDAAAPEPATDQVDRDLLTPEVVERINRLLGGRAPQQRRLVAVPTILSVRPDAPNPPGARAASARADSPGSNTLEPPAAVDSAPSVPPTNDGPEARWSVRRTIVASITVLGILAAVRAMF